MLLNALLLLSAAAAQQDPPPVPPGSGSSGPPAGSELLEGWETSLDDIPPASDCENIGQPMIQPLNPPHREQGVAILSDVAFLLIPDEEAARLLGLPPAGEKPLATAIFRAFLDEMRQRKHRALVERSDSWSVADQRELETLNARFETGDHSRYRPYLVRAVGKFGDGHGGPPHMGGDLCGGDLHIGSLTFSYTIPPSVPVPAVVFLPRAPQRVIATVMVAH